MKVSIGLNLVSSLCAGLAACALAVDMAASSSYTQVPQKNLLVLVLLFSILELGITSLSTFLGFYVIFCCTWMYLNPDEDVPMVTAAPLESPPQQMQLPEPKAPAVPGS